MFFIWNVPEQPQYEWWFNNDNLLVYLNKCEDTNVHIHELRKTDQILSNHMNIGCLDN